MTGLIIAAVYVAFTVVMVLALTYSGRTTAQDDSRIAIHDEATVELGLLDETFAWMDAVDAMPDVTVIFAHIIAEHSERTET